MLSMDCYDPLVTEWGFAMFLPPVNKLNHDLDYRSIGLVLATCKQSP